MRTDYFLSLDQGVSRSSYGERERHRLHPIWRRNALKQLADLARREKDEAFLPPARTIAHSRWSASLGTVPGHAQ